MSEIRGVGQVLITVEDIDRAVAFYRDTLGIPFLFQVPGQDMAFLDCGGVRLYLGKSDRPDFHSSPVLYLTVDDIDAAHQRLRQRGVDLLGEPEIVHSDESIALWTMFLRDPDGHHLALMEERPLDR